MSRWQRSVELAFGLLNLAACGAAAGHGERDDTSVSLKSAQTKLPASQLLAKLALAQRSAPFALLLNTCHSGHIMLPPTLQPWTLLGAAFGETPSLSPTGAGRTVFGDAVALALEGAADCAPIGNGDGVVTDAEAFELVSQRLAGQALLAPPPGEPDLLTGPPGGVLKRNVDAELPLARSRFAACLARTRPASQPDDELSRSAAAYADVLKIGAAFKQPARSRRFLFVLAAGELAAQVAPLLAQLRAFEAGLAKAEGRPGWMVAAATAAESELVARARAASYLDVLLLSASHAALGGTYLELRRARDGSVLWGKRYALGLLVADVAEAGRAVAQRLPRRFSLLRTSRARDALSVLLRVTAQPARNLSVLSWADFPKPSFASARAFAVAGGAPCPGGFGQCFQVHDDDIYEKAEQWLVVDSP